MKNIIERFILWHYRNKAKKLLIKQQNLTKNGEIKVFKSANGYSNI